jgi:dolichol kinase
MSNFIFMLLLFNSDNSSIFSRDTVKTFLETFLQHITNHYDKHSDLYCIYLFIYLVLIFFS